MQIAILYNKTIKWTGQMSWKTSYRFTESTTWADIIGFLLVCKARSYPSGMDERTTVVIISGMNFCNFKSCPLNTPRNPIRWLMSKPYLHSEIPNRFSDILRAPLPIPILVYGQQDYKQGNVTLELSSIVSEILNDGNTTLSSTLNQE